VVDHREDDGLAADLGQLLNKVHRNIHPHLGRNDEELQQAIGLQCLHLVALTCAAHTHPILDQDTIIEDVEVSAEAVQCLLDSLMARRMGQKELLVMQVPVV
jgi:hypothetical protein